MKERIKRWRCIVKRRIWKLSMIALVALMLCMGCGKADGTPSENSQLIEDSQVESQTESEAVSEVGEDTETEVEAAGKNESQVADKNQGNTSTIAPSVAFPTPSTSGELQVIGAKLCDSKGNPITLRGISTHGINWFPQYVNEAAFGEFRNNWHANVIRLAMYTAEYNGYCSGGNKEELKQLVKNGVEYATKNDMYVIIDWHILSDNNPQQNKGEAIAFFKEISALYANYNNVIYEICNEPNGGTSWADIKAYANEVIPVIRANDSNAIIIVGTPNWSQYVNEAAADPITGYSNIMYALHFYAATHTDWLRNTMVQAINAGLPIFVTEYGICDASGNGAIDEYQANEWVKVMNQYGISHVAWNISNKAETSAIFNTGCNKTSGWTEEDLSASGKWLYQMLHTYNK